MAFDPLTAGIDLARELTNKFFPDAGQAEKDKMVMAMAVMQSQSDINKQEAANTNVFVSGWRPFIGWTCGAGFATEYVLNPFLTWATLLAGKAAEFPHIQIDALMALLVPMLGLGAFRTYEKVKGVAGK